jgi:hypothetical protein
MEEDKKECELLRLMTSHFLFLQVASGWPVLCIPVQRHTNSRSSVEMKCCLNFQFIFRFITLCTSKLDAMTLSINTGSRELEEWRLARFCTVYVPLQRYKNIGLPRGRGWSSEGGGIVCMRDIFILNEIWAHDKVHSLVGTLLRLNILLIT